MTNSWGFSWTRAFETNRNLIASVDNRFGASTVSRFDYANDSLARRTRRVDNLTVTNDFSYNVRSEVIGALKAYAVAESLRRADAFFRQRGAADRYGAPCRISVDDSINAAGLSSFAFTHKDPLSEGDYDRGPDYGVLWLKWEGFGTLVSGEGPALFSPDGRGYELMTRESILKAKKPKCELCYAGSMSAEWVRHAGLSGETWLTTRGRGQMNSSVSNLDVIEYIIKILNHYKCCYMTSEGKPLELLARPVGDRIEMNQGVYEPYTRIGGRWESCPTCSPDSGQPWRCMND